PYERPSFAAVLAGARAEHLALDPADVDVYDAKAIAVEMIERMTSRQAEVVGIPANSAPHLHPRGAGRLSVEGRVIGTFGPLHPDVLEAFDLDGAPLVVELDLAAIEALGQKKVQYRPIPKLPAISRDLTMLVSDRVAASDVIAAIAAGAGELCESVQVQSEFRGGSVPTGQRALTFRLVYRDPLARTNSEQARTLTDKEVDEVEARVLESTREKLGITLRA
ncbi:MAG TPA: hypothetical protein VLC09_10205, partial [Polyangiaceae bacterium]|nr:hypothetical protein [Polyangiaceae bacterium]